MFRSDVVYIYLYTQIQDVQKTWKSKKKKRRNPALFFLTFLYFMGLFVACPSTQYVLWQVYTCENVRFAEAPCPFLTFLYMTLHDLHLSQLKSSFIQNQHDCLLRANKVAVTYIYIYILPSAYPPPCLDVWGQRCRDVHACVQACIHWHVALSDTCAWKCWWSPMVKYLKQSTVCLTTAKQRANRPTNQWSRKLPTRAGIDPQINPKTTKK